MPELPEVEAVARSLNNLLSGRRILAAVLLRTRLAPETSPEEFSRLIRRTSVKGVGRRGKHLLINFGNDRTLITHLRMSGRFLLVPEESEYPKFTHAVFHLNNSQTLIFQDQRHFGFMKVVETAKLDSARELAKLAPEPFSEGFSEAYFKTVLKASKRSLKELLLDQTKVCGLGNIYASEAMYLSGISPRRRGFSVSAKRSSVLRTNILQVLSDAIARETSANLSHNPSVESSYGTGSTPRWRVYGREGEPCSSCGTSIARLKQAGRSTFFCPVCQRR